MLQINNLTRDEYRALLDDICVDESEGKLTCCLCGRTTDKHTAINTEEWTPEFYHEEHSLLRPLLRYHTRRQDRTGDLTMQYITLPNGKKATITQYVNAWYALIDCHPATPIRNWEWHECCAGDVLAAIRRGLQDRINRRAGLTIREANPTRIQRQLRKRIKHSCRWCGTSLGRYEPEFARFCDGDCYRAHSS